MRMSSQNTNKAAVCDAGRGSVVVAVAIKQDASDAILSNKDINKKNKFINKTKNIYKYKKKENSRLIEKNVRNNIRKICERNN